MKKAITPLISTILLIVFAIGLGVLVISWGDAQELNLHECEEVSLAFTRLADADQLCVQNDAIDVTLENNGKSQVSKVEVVYLTTSGTYSFSRSVGLAPGSFERTSIPLPSGQGDILKVRIIPYVGKEICSAQRAESESVKVCP